MKERRPEAMTRDAFVISLAKLEANFYPVIALDNGLIRCADELPIHTIYTYFRLGDGSDATRFVTSRTIIDDAFAALIMDAVAGEAATILGKERLPANSYGFTHVLRVPPDYHRELMGRLDEERLQTTLCIPIFDAEFSGTETVQDFFEMRRHLVMTTDWGRAETPKIRLRYDNPKTRAGTGDGYALVSQAALILEIDNLPGVHSGFVEIINHLDEVIEILFDRDDWFTLIRDRNDSERVSIQRTALVEAVRNFLTRPSPAG